MAGTKPTTKGGRQRVSVDVLLGTTTAPGVFPTDAQELPDERLSTDEQPQIHQVEIDRILDNDFQTREDIDPLKYAQLVHSITTQGFREPLAVCPNPGKEGTYLLVAGGHTRRYAAKEVGLTVIPVFIVEATDRQIGIATAQENLARMDLNPVEEGKLYLKLRQRLGLTQDELADELGQRDRSRIKECEAAAQSAPDIQTMLRTKASGGLRAAKYLRRIDSSIAAHPEDREALMQARGTIIDRFEQGALTTEGVKAAVEDVLQKKGGAPDQSPIPAGGQKPVAADDADGANTESAAATPGSPTETALHPDEEVVPLPFALQQPEEHTSGRRTQHDTARRTDSHDLLERAGQLRDVVRRFQRYQRMIGSDAPSHQERRALLDLDAFVQDILRRPTLAE